VRQHRHHRQTEDLWWERPLATVPAASVAPGLGESKTEVTALDSDDENFDASALVDSLSGMSLLQELEAIQARLDARQAAAAAIEMADVATADALAEETVGGLPPEPLRLHGQTAFNRRGADDPPPEAEEVEEDEQLANDLILRLLDKKIRHNESIASLVGTLDLLHTLMAPKLPPVMLAALPRTWYKTKARVKALLPEHIRVPVCPILVERKGSKKKEMCGAILRDSRYSDDLRRPPPKASAREWSC
jgi:hypothetical protein